MKNYRFTETWFTEDGLSSITELDRQGELHFLEIGSFEGKSTVWYMDRFLSHPNSTITCIEPWYNYGEGIDSLNSYGSENSHWKFAETNVKDRFFHNIDEQGEKDKAIIYQGLSDVVLPRLIAQEKKYDLIFVDGNHVAPYVLMDACMSWPLLKVGGYMVFDDYRWGLEKSVTLRPRKSIDSFVEIFGDYIEDVYTNDRKIIRRVR